MINQSSAVYAKYFCFCLALSVVITIGLRTPTYLARQVFNPDEGTLAAVANTILDGGVPYRDSWDTRGPTTFYIYAAVFALCGRNNMLAVHALVMLVTIACSFLLMRIGRRLNLGAAGDAAGPLWAAVSFSYLPLDMLAANVEIFMVLFLLLGFLFVLRGGQENRLSSLLAAGASFSAAFLTKQPALIDMAGAAFFLLWRSDAGLGWRRKIAGIAVMALGFTLPVALVAAVYGFIGAWPDFVFGFWTYYADYFLPAMSAGKRFLNIFVGAWAVMRDNAFAWLTGIGGLALAIHRIVKRRLPAENMDLAAIWAVTSFVAASGSGRGFGHYYIQFLPPLVLLSADFCFRTLPRIVGRLIPFIGSNRTDEAKNSTPARISLCFLIIGYLVPVLLYLEPKQFRSLAHAAEIITEPVAKRNLRGAGESMRELVTRLRNETDQDDTIFVWGFFPQIYVRADRRPASRFSYCIYLTGLVPWVNTHPRVDTSRYIVPGSWDLLMADLERSKPEFIIDTSPGDNNYWRKYPPRKYPRLAAFIKSGYDFAGAVRDKRGREDFHLYRRRI